MQLNVEVRSSSSSTHMTTTGTVYNHCGNSDGNSVLNIQVAARLRAWRGSWPRKENARAGYIWASFLICSEMAICFRFFILFPLMPLLVSGVLLPSPRNITILSTNMKHFLVWSPVIVPGEAVKYSVEFQGEYERDYANDSWIPIGECTGISVTQCDITEDISATVPYNLRVRAALGSQASHWATLNGFFNRVTTSLIPPMVTVTADGYHLLVELEHLGRAFEFWIFYWRKGQEHKIYHKVLKDSGTTVHLDTMEGGAEYCVKAQSYVEAINRSSNFSQVQCVRAEDGKTILVTFAPLFFFVFVVTVLALPWVAWKTCWICQYSCFPNESLPDTLKLTESPARILNYRGEEMEKCDEFVQVLPPEELLLRFWIHETL
ncbi:interleukin-20 receptor subunit beta [Rhineura floridana]|uniref:interleukin-20 receptor subunit beta n=1 Tax=Rhineura floridana TaxID=261503 RepID=UPI002AC88A08|nr:interleukin-20 receptor subunit beta [Rhineura floridana]